MNKLYTLPSKHVLVTTDAQGINTVTYPTTKLSARMAAGSEPEVGDIDELALTIVGGTKSQQRRRNSA